MNRMFTLEKMWGYIIGAVLGLLFGTMLYFVQPVKWKGQALIKIGQTQNQNFIEPLETVMERLKSRSFIQAVAHRAKNDEIKKLLNLDEDAGMAIKSLRNADAIIITVVGGPAELVQDSIDSIVAELTFKHDAIINSYKADTLKELDILALEQNALTLRLANVLKGKAYETGFGVIAIQYDLDYKLKRYSQLRELISSANIRPTSLIEDVSVIEKRMFSSLWRACMFGAILGILLSIIWIRWRK